MSGVVRIVKKKKIRNTYNIRHKQMHTYLKKYIKIIVKEGIYIY